jgi:hydrogenase maturation factor HypF (carbamoyltransferase family)
MSISKVTGFKWCNICEMAIQDIRYHQFLDRHYHIQKACTPDSVKHGMKLKMVKSHKFPVKRRK